jgi:serine/threonine protein kinase
MSCLDAQTVAALFAGELARLDRDRVDDHVDTCTPCRRWIATAARDHVGRETTLGDLVDASISTSAETMQVGEPGRIALAPGTQVGRYIVRDFLGAGAMGVVYEAHDPKLDRSVALKVVRAGADRIGQQRALRFVREAQAMARVSHPNVVPIYDAGQTDTVVYIAMKRVDGVSLRQHLQRARLSHRDRLELLCAAGRGLAAAHATGIVHRDFKPDNVLVGADGVAQVADFGLAALTDERELDDAEPRPEQGSDAFQTSAGTILGTPAYMAPEVKRGQRADALSDQYSFAVTVREALGTSIPRRIQRALQRALVEEPGERYPSIDVLIKALEQRPVAAWIGVGAMAMVATAWIAWPAEKQDFGATCDLAAGDRLGAVFGSDARHELAASFTRLEQLHPKDAAATLEQLDRYTSGWLAMRRNTCRARASGEVSVELSDLRMACLEERLDELAVVKRNLGSLTGAHADLAPRITSVLGDLEQCTNPRGLRARAGTDPIAVLIARTLRAQLAEAHALLQQGHYARAMPMFDQVLAATRAAGLPAVEAEALLGRAVVLARTRRPGSSEGFHQALAIAERIGDAALRVDALIALLADAAIDRSRASEIELLVKLIETGLADLPGKHTLRRARVAGNLSNYHEDRQDFAAAEKSADAAMRAFREELGPLHPYTVMARDTQARIQSTQGRHDKAIEIKRELLVELRRTYGDGHPLVAQSELGLGVYLAHAQRPDEASAAFERALATMERVYGPDHVRVAEVLRKVGYLALDRDPKAARVAFARAVAIFEKTARKGPELAPLLAGLGEAELLTGEPSAAVGTLERALAAWGDSQITPHLIPTAKFALARALWEAGGDRPRARSIAEDARAGFLANKGPWLPKAEEVAAWLKSHI